MSAKPGTVSVTGYSPSGWNVAPPSHVDLKGCAIIRICSENGRSELGGKAKAVQPEALTAAG